MTYSIPELRPRQQQLANDIRNSFREHNATLAVAHTAFGKCLGKGTPVIMFDGTVKPVEDVVAGDLLMGPDSKPRTVVSIARGREMMYRVTPKSGDPYVVNESHILSLRRTKVSNNPRWASEAGGGEIVNITVRDYLKKSDRWKHIHKGWRAAVDFPSMGPLPIPPYVLGAWLGDGTAGKPQFTVGDKEIVREIEAYADSVGMRVCITPNSANSDTVSIWKKEGRYGAGGSPFGNALRSMGVYQEKRVPLSYKRGSREDRLQLLAGLIDTDGYCAGYGYDFTLKSEELLDDIMFVARSLGFSCTKRAVQKTCGNNGATGTYYQCHIGGHVHEIPCRLQRKIMKARNLRKNVLNTGITVEPIGVDDYYGFEISGNDRLFLLGDFTVTHNTILFCYIVASAAAKGRRVVIIAHRQELISQISTALRKFGVDHGIISPQYTPSYYKAVQVASIATLNARFNKIPAKFTLFDLAILDEAHHLLASNTFGKVYDLLGRIKLLGVTATPERGDGKGLGENCGGVFQDMVLGPSVRESIDEGYLSDFTVYAPATQLDLSGIRTRMGDYDKKALQERIDKPTVTGDAVKEYARICPTYPAVVFCVSLEHCRHVAAEFQAAGFDFRVIDGTMDDATRKSLIDGLGKTHLGLVSCDIISEGTDVPSIACAIFLRPTKSLGLYIQQAGRAIRPVYAEGYDLSTREGRLAALANGPKPKAILLDHAGLTMQHGLIDEEREWSLEGRKKAGKKKAAAEPRTDMIQCSGPNACFAVFNRAPACPNCGKPVEVNSRTVEQVDGQLIEMTKEMAEQLRKQKRNEVKSAKTLEELERIGAERGYSPGWARATFEAKQRIRAKYTRRPAPPEPPLEKLKQMTIPELEAVARQQGWSRDFASDFYHNKGLGAQQSAPGGA